MPIATPKKQVGQTSFSSLPISTTMTKIAFNLYTHPQTIMYTHNSLLCWFLWALHSLVEYREFQYFLISSAVLPGILPAIRDHLSPTRLNILMISVSSSSENWSSESWLSSLESTDVSFEERSESAIFLLEQRRNRVACYSVSWVLVICLVKLGEEMCWKWWDLDVLIGEERERRESIRGKKRISTQKRVYSLEEWKVGKATENGSLTKWARGMVGMVEYQWGLITAIQVC